MALTLRVMSYHNQAMGPDSVRVVQEQGCTIGRGSANAWVLPDPERYVSTEHARIECQGGTYFLNDVSTNGTFVNGSPRPVGPGAPVMLQDGDRIQIGDYEIAVGIDATGGAEVPAAVPAFEEPLAGQSGILADPQLDPHGTVDPLEALEASHIGPGPQPQQIGDGWETADSAVDPYGQIGAEPDNVPAQEQFFQPPGVTPPPAAGAPPGQAPGGIPEDWDLTGFSPASRPPEPEFGAQPEQSLGAPPEPAFGAPPEQGLSPPPPQQPAYAQPTAPAPPVPDPSLAPAAPPAAPPSYAQPQPGPPAAHPGDLTSLTMLLQGVGLDPACIPPEAAPQVMQTLGQTFREVVQGMMEVLQARADLKSQFRVPLTTIRPVENNPLKFSVGVDDALQHLLIRQGTGFLGPVDAVREGFHDIKAHQMAMMAGMRAAFDEMMGRFDPEELQRNFDKGLKRGGLLGMANKSKYWELYNELYRKLTRDLDDNFQRMFGDTFARAYEEQMQKLTALLDKSSQ